MATHLRRSTCALVALLTLGLAGSTRAADAGPRRSAGCRRTTIASGRGVRHTIDVAGLSRAYILDVPEGVHAQQPVPLLFDFHGFGHSAAGVWEVSKFRDLAARDGFITVYPDGLPVDLLGRTAAGWEIFHTAPNRDLAFVRRLLDDLEDTYCIDRTRVFATGFSNGGFFSNILGCTMAERFAAVAPVSGGRLTVPCTPGRGVPVMIHHGRNDPLIDVQQARETRDAWVQIDQCREDVNDGCDRHRQCRDGAEVVYCEDDGAHHWPVAATDRIWEFFKRHPMRH